MSEPFIGEIRMWAGNFVPRSWAFCQGQLYAVAQNQALFSILGTTYGGNGQTTFALPDFRGRVPVGTGQPPGTAPYQLGQMAGSETVTLIQNQMPAHVHGYTVPVTSEDATVKTPVGNVPATSQAAIYGPNTNEVGFQGNTGIAGGSQPHPNMQPYLAINVIIAVQGIYPSRN